MSSKNPFRNKNCPPPFIKGEFVTPLVKTRYYGKWRHGEFREILDVYWDDTNDPYGSWVLVIFNPLKANMTGLKHQCSKYNPANFTKENYLMPAPTSNNDFCLRPVVEKTRYFAIREVFDPSVDELPRYEVVAMQGTHEEIQHVVEKDLNAGEVVYITKATVKLEALPPRPPIRRTELR